MVCTECKKPKKSKCKKKLIGKPQKGKKLYKKLKKQDDIPFEVIPTKCLGKCKKGPNGVILPERKRVHLMSLESIRLWKDKEPKAG